MNISGLDLNLLLVFDALVVERSATRAGARLHLSQPTISNALARLRGVLDDPLFVRTRNGMEPTGRALALHEHVRMALQMIERGLEASGKFDPLASDWKIKLVMSDIGEVIYLPKLMREMQTCAPRMSVTAAQLERSDLYGSVLDSGEVDLIMGYAPPLGSNFHQQRLFDDEQVCLVRDGHPRVRNKVALKQFQEESHVVIAPIWSKLHPFEASLRSLKIERRVVLQVGHYLALPHIIRETDFLCCMPSRAVKALPMAGVKAIPLSFKYPAMHMSQFWHRRNDLDPKNCWLRSLVAKVIAET